MSDEDERVLVRNPRRVPGQIAPEEKEVVNLYKSGESQEKTILKTKTYEYWAPFSYPNITVELGRENSGAEYNPDGVELDIPPHGAITITEEEPIVSVTVIGSACVPPGYVMLSAEPCTWKYPRTGIKMKVENLWGMHNTIRIWSKGVDEGFRFAGMSSADFDVPDSRKVTIMCGSSMDYDAPPAPSEAPTPSVNTEKKSGYWNDPHYCVRTIRVTVRE